jgi:arabinogalactan oligomer/maltooligosaccharide transport system substrate-binding protein
MTVRRVGLPLIAALGSAILLLVSLLMLLAPLSSARASPIPDANSKQVNHPTTSVTLTVWSYSSAPVLTSIVNDFQAAYPTVTVQLAVMDMDTIIDTFPNAARSGTGPDLLWQEPNDQAILFASQGLLRSVDTDFDLTLFLTDTVDGIAWQGSHWGVPETNGNHLMLLYNKALLSTPPTNTIAMISVAQTFTDSVYGLVYNLNEPFWLIPWLSGFGGWPLDMTTDPITPTLDSTAMISALQFIQDLKFTYHAVPSSCDSGCADTNFREGKAAMLINGDWSLSSYSGLSPTVQLGIARIPLVSDTGLWPAPMTSGMYFLFNRYTSNQQYQASRLFVQFATTKPEQLQWAQEGIIPALLEALQDPLVQGNPILQSSLEQLLVGQPMPGVPEMRCAWDAISGPLADVMDIGRSPSVAAAEMQASAVSCVNALHLKKIFLPLVLRQ